MCYLSTQIQIQNDKILNLVSIQVWVSLLSNYSIKLNQSTDRAVLGKLTVIQFQPKAHKQGETGVSLLSFANKPISEAIARGKKPDQIVLQMLNTGPPHFKDLEKFQEFNQLDTTKMAASSLYNKQAATGTKPVVRGQSE